MWRRLRWLRWAALALVVVIVAGAVALVLVERPELDDRRAAVDARWASLRQPLRAHYERLADALNTFAAAGGGDRQVTKELGAALSTWTRALESGDAAQQVDAANRLEAQATRLRTDVSLSERFKANPALADAIIAFEGSAPPPPLVEAYRRAVLRYQERRRSTLGTPVARVLGFDERPVLVLGG